MFIIKFRKVPELFSIVKFVRKNCLISSMFFPGSCTFCPVQSKAFSFTNSKPLEGAWSTTFDVYTVYCESSSANSKHFSGCRQLFMDFYRTSDWLCSRIPKRFKAFFWFSKTIQGLEFKAGICGNHVRVSTQSRQCDAHIVVTTCQTPANYFHLRHKRPFVCLSVVSARGVHPMGGKTPMVHGNLRGGG